MCICTLRDRIPIYSKYKTGVGYLSLLCRRKRAIRYEVCLVKTVIIKSFALSMSVRSFSVGSYLTCVFVSVCMSMYAAGLCFCALACRKETQVGRSRFLSGRGGSVRS